MADANTNRQSEALAKIRNSSNYVLAGVGVTVVTILLSYSFYFGYVVNLERSEDPQAWVHFSSIFSNFLSPSIAAIVLWFVVRSYYLQKTEFEGVRDNLTVQLQIDSLLRRQSGLIDESRNICSLIEQKWQSKTTISRELEDQNGLGGLVSEQLFNKPPNRKVLTVEVLAKELVKMKHAGNYHSSRPALNEDLYFVLNQLRIIDLIMGRILVIDTQLSKLQPILDDGYAKSVLFSIRPRMFPFTQIFSTLGYADSNSEANFDHI